MEGFLNTPGVSEDPEWGHSIHTANIPWVRLPLTVQRPHFEDRWSSGVKHLESDLEKCSKSTH